MAGQFLYSSEIAPLEYRHIGTGAAASGEWLMVCESARDYLTG